MVGFRREETGVWFEPPMVSSLHGGWPVMGFVSVFHWQSGIRICMADGGLRCGLWAVLNRSSSTWVCSGETPGEFLCKNEELLYGLAVGDSMHENRAHVLVFSGLVDRGMRCGNCVVLDFSGIFGPFPVIYDGVMEFGLDWRCFLRSSAFFPVIWMDFLVRSSAGDDKRLKETKDWNSDQLLEMLTAGSLTGGGLGCRFYYFNYGSRQEAPQKVGSSSFDSWFYSQCLLGRWNDLHMNGKLLVSEFEFQIHPPC
nr:hypothetical protein Iba_chr03fCG0020 [Ipomoea batatas]